ncbi:MAG: hypothetical protein QOG68_127 [Solirubrobacteraceae bacterium]|nr:hypothetical protein [Solirubrobacteraceae bacterium]
MVVRRAILAAVIGVLAAPALNAGSAGRPECFGAASRDPEQPCVNPALRYSVTPSPAAALNAPNAPCESIPGGGPNRCSFGSPSADATESVALIGDSHATHWRSAMLTVASRNHWYGISISRSGCPFTRAVPALPDSAGCVRWNKQVLAFLTNHPEIRTVVVSEHRGRVRAPPGADHRKVQIAGYMAAWKALPDSVTNLIVIRDTPYRRGRSGDCIVRAQQRREEPGQVCAVPRSSALKSDPAATAALRVDDPRVSLVDMTHYFCSSTLCYPVIGGALVHKDTTHISLTYGLTLGPYLLRKINRVLGRR